MTDKNPRFEPVRSVRLSQRIVEQIEAAIASGEIRPGQHLPSERELVVQFEASRPTIREALRVLESNGLIRSRPGDPRGPLVLPFSSAGLSKQLSRLVAVDTISMAEVVAFRMVLDGSANRLAAQLHTPTQLALMERTIVQMEAAIEEGYERFSEADVAFHDAIAVASRNQLIQVCNKVVRGIVVTLVADKLTHTPDRAALMAESVMHHREVLDLIRARDGAAAASVSRRNLYDYYAPHVDEADRAMLEALLDTDED